MWISVYPQAGYGFHAFLGYFEISTEGRDLEYVSGAAAF
jgi:hypothetical protein